MINVKIFQGLGKMLNAAAGAAAGAPKATRTAKGAAPCTPCAANAMVQAAKQRAKARQVF